MKSFKQAAAHFGSLAAGGYKQNLSPILDMIGTAVKHEVQSEIGEYQPGVGPYPPMAPLADATLERKTEKGLGKTGDPNSPLWATGEFHDSIQTAKSISELSVEVGTDRENVVAHELGTSNEPPRPIFGPSVLRALPPLLPAISAAAAMGISGGVWKGLTAEAITHTNQGPGANIEP